MTVLSPSLTATLGLYRKTQLIVWNKSAIYDFLSCVNQGLTVKVTMAHYLLPRLRVWGNAAVKPLPAVNNGTLCVKVLQVSVCARTCVAAVGSMYVFKPVAITRSPAAPSAQSSGATFRFMQPAAAVHIDHDSVRYARCSRVHASCVCV